MRISTYSSRETVPELIKVTKALSDETRLRILNVLLVKECCVCEVMQALDISQSRASRNLGILQEAGFLKARRDGAWMLYCLDWKTTNRYAAALAKLMAEFLVSNQMLARDREKLKHAVRVGPGCNLKQVGKRQKGKGSPEK